MTTASYTNMTVGDVSKINVTAYLLEDLLNTVIDLSNQGYEIVTGSTVGYGQVKSVVMSKKVTEQVTTVKEVNSVLEDTKQPEEDSSIVVLDEDYLITIAGDKDSLEAYGKDFGIDLKKNKSYDNMLKDLREFVGNV